MGGEERREQTEKDGQTRISRRQLSIGGILTNLDVAPGHIMSRGKLFLSKLKLKRIKEKKEVE